MRIQRTLLILLSFVNLTFLSAQCTDTYLKVLGTKSSSERGYALVASPTERSVYVSATREDSLIILKLDSLGQLIWSRRLEIETGRAESINGLVLDADGMLGIVGTVGNIDQQGNCFVARYDPNANILLWSQRMLSTSMGFASGILEVGENYVVFNNPTSPNDAEVFLVSIANGAINNNFSKHYHVGNAETIGDMVLYNGALYGTGRFTQGAAPTSMRNAIFSMNPASGDLLWTRLGHKSEFDDARMYGIDILIAKNSIYAVSLGDENGGSIDATEIFVQRLDLDGNVLWVRQYELPGGNDWVDEIVETPTGLVVMGRNRVTPSDVILFNIDFEGNVQWAKRYDHDVNDNSVTLGGITSQLVLLEDHLYFTAFADNTDADILLIRTDLQGNVSGDCDNVEALNIPVRTIDNPVFYAIEPDVSDFVPERVSLPVNVGIDINMIEQLVCGIPAAIHTEVHAEICEGDSYEGYSVSGSFQDTFATARGCDSVRTLHLLVEICQPDCGSVASNVFGESFTDEHGRCITASKFEPAVFIAGDRDDNTLLIKMDLNGDIIWTRILNMVDTGDEVPAGIIEDSDGTLVVVGTGIDYIDGGVVYAFRYDPDADIILWANQYMHSPNDMAWGVIEKEPGGNYVFNLQPNFYDDDFLDAEVVEIDRNTGETVTTLSKNYRIIGTETLFEITYHDGAIYGTGRYKDGGEIDDLRTTLVKLDGDDGDQQWVKMGHRETEHPARLYGDDLVIDNDAIYVFSHGDPDGSSTVNTDVFIQKTDLNGNLTWIFEYELPGEADYTQDMIAADGGLIVLGASLSNEQFYMFKIDHDGVVQWGQQYVLSDLMGNVEWERGNPLLTKAGDNYFFTGFVINSTGDKDLLIVRTDLEGHVSANCLQSEPIVIDRLFVENVDWYDRAVNQFQATHVVSGRQPQIEEIPLLPLATCSVADTLYSELAITICQGQSFEDYTEPGIYQDTFITAEGCDSIRNLTLTVTPPIEFRIHHAICHGESFMGFTQTGVYADTFSLASGCDSIRTLRLTVLSCEPVAVYDLDACRSYMSDGSIMDYSEFDPEYPNGLDCGTVTATNLFRSPPAENKHSCTDGLNGTLAMCISALGSCTYLPGNNASAIMEITFTPDQDSTIAFNKLEFYEKAPVTYSWIDGPSGLNDYPRFYGIRILKNGTQVFEQHDITTSQTWALQTYTFNNLPEFKVTGMTTFRIELLPYCPIGNGAPVSAWDLEDIRLYASCAPEDNAGLVINGTAATWNETPVYKATIQLSATSTFESTTPKETTAIGAYRFDDVRRHQQYYLKAEKNTNLLQGVNTLDIIVLQKHLLGKQTFNSLDQYIAGDINHTGTINSMDMIELRKSILGMQDEFTNNTSWRFAVKPVDMESRNMDDFIETAYIESLFAPSTINWLGVKIGDVNRDVKAGVSDVDIVVRSAPSYPMRTAIVQEENQVVTIRFIATEEVDVEGLQLSFNAKDASIASVVPAAITLTAANVNIDQQGVFRLSWNADNAESVKSGSVLFTLKLRVPNGQGESFEIVPTDDVLSQELYTPADVRAIVFKPADNGTASTQESLADFDIVPNPFTSQVTLQFTIDAPGKVQFVFYDAFGIVRYGSEKNYEAGAHAETILASELGLNTTLLFCQMIYDNQVLTKKVLRTE